MKKYIAYSILFMSLCFCRVGVGQTIGEGGEESDQGRTISEVSPGKVVKPGETVVEAEKPIEEKVEAVEVLEPCQVGDILIGDDQEHVGVAGEHEIVDGMPGVIASVDIKTWLIAGGVILLVIIGMAVLSTRKVTID